MQNLMTTQPSFVSWNNLRGPFSTYSYLENSYLDIFLFSIFYSILILDIVIETYKQNPWQIRFSDVKYVISLM